MDDEDYGDSLIDVANADVFEKNFCEEVIDWQESKWAYLAQFTPVAV